MRPSKHDGGRSGRPRVVLAGEPRGPLGLPSPDLVPSLRDHLDIAHVDGRGGPFALARRLARLVTEEGYQTVHFLDARLALAGTLLRRRCDVPVTAAVSARDVVASPRSWLARRALGSFDHAFVPDASVAAALRAQAPWLTVSVVAPASGPLPAPSKAAAAEVGRALQGLAVGRLVLGMPWPEHLYDLRWFRDAVLPQLATRPVCLLMGVPHRRRARLLTGAVGVRASFRSWSREVDADAVAAAARYVDAFVLPAAWPRMGAGAELATVLTLGGVPLVSAHDGGGVLVDELNAFLVPPGDERSFASTVDRVLAMPAVQRHFLGADFARETVARRSWGDVAEAYAERLASLTGRPMIPADLRAA